MQKNSRSTRTGVVIDESEVIYNMSIDRKLSVYSAEALVIEKAVEYVHENIIGKDILILLNSQSMCKAIRNTIVKY